ncbi:uncharacterized protein LOC134262045 [Saccostrea cucullata]|uniref:uncharacterized protein LOC134262045 n=1 Tax=Saccostrea cuccullata TaxID=36930 RepID=UPI002ED6A4F1
MHRKDCIVIYCWVKGFIPVGEKAFPKKIKNIDVDVREGACFFAADENFLQIGSKIGRRYGSSLGTLGGFVNIDSSTIGCLTCAHVVCPPAAIQSEDIVRFISSNLIEVENKSDSDVIGTVERAVFKHSNSREVSVDAALVKISRQHPENGSFLLEISDAQLLSAGFSAYNRPAFTNGAIIKIDSTNYRRPLLKCGASSGLTVGYAHCINVHAAIINDKEIEFEFGNFKVHGQIEVLPVQRPDKENEAANNKFAINGDSGSLVFMIEEDMPPVLKCVGMVTAVTTYGSCLVTPIDHVLLDLGLPLNAFCKFGNEDQSRSDVEINDTIVERIVRDVTQAISTNFDSTFQTINRRLDALEERNSM